MKITLNGTTEIDLNFLVGFKLIADLEEGLPHGYFECIDKNGEFFAKFEDISIGSEMELEIYYSELKPGDISSKKKPGFIEFKKFNILKLEDNGMDNPSTLAGTVRVYFGHPWLLFKDVKNHAYDPMKISDLIKKIVTSEDRGKAFEIDSKNLAKSDDTAELSRYKANETDWDFIYNKLLPYTASEQNPLHFFCTEKGNFFLKSFKQLYKENCKVIFMPDASSQSDPKLVDLAKKEIEKNGIDKEYGNQMISSIECFVSSDDMSKEMFPKFFIENVSNGQGVTGGKIMTNSIAPHAGTSFGNFLPLDFRFTSSATGSYVKVVHNRSLNDGVLLLFASGTKVDSIFEIQLTTSFCGWTTELGNTAYFVMPYLTIDDERKIHWASGKWLIRRIEHYIEKGGEDVKTRLISKITLGRSNFVGDERSTTIAMLPFLHESP